MSSLAAHALCGDSGIVCDIQKDYIKAGINMRWGAWLAEPGEGITIHEISEDPLGFIDSNTQEDENILTFWLTAEHVDINTLTSTANFASTSFTDCTDYGQCIGFADDGAVRNLVGQFDVNFNNGAITNGQIKFETAGADIYHASALPLLVWEVNFNGQMSTAANGSKLPEFQTNKVSGTIVDGIGNPISNKIIGNLGGIFVKPGTVFAGGFNLGTADNSNKHAAGVFTLEKHPRKRDEGQV